jgi:hypothetical protein
MALQAKIFIDCWKKVLAWVQWVSGIGKLESEKAIQYSPCLWNISWLKTVSNREVGIK